MNIATKYVELRVHSTYRVVFFSSKVVYVLLLVVLVVALLFPDLKGFEWGTYTVEGRG